MELTGAGNNKKRKRSESLDFSAMVYGKIPPQSREVEEAILGTIMLEKTAYYRADEIIQSDCFYVDAHQKIYSCFRAINKRAAIIDIFTVIEELKTREELDIVGGPYAITKLTNAVTSSANLEEHCRIVLQKFLQRELIKISGEVINEAYEDASDVFDLLDDTESKYRKIAMRIDSIKKTPLSNIAKEIIEDYDKKAYYSQNDLDDPDSVYTGMPEWDKINGRLFGGLYVVAARPSVGKGVHMTELICRMAKKYSVGVINGEMTNKQLMMRVGCNLLDINNHLWKKLVITPEDQDLVKEAMEAAIQLDWDVLEEKYIDRIASQITTWKLEGKKVILADMLNLFSVSEEMAKYMPTERQQMNYILLTLAFLAKRLNLPIILYAHMNREVLKRSSKEPNLGDLKDSGKIEDVAFQVSFLHRPELYDPTQTEDEWGEDVRGLMYQIIVKHRDGENGRLKFNARLAQSRLEEREADNVISDWKPSVAVPFDGKSLAANDDTNSLDDDSQDDDPF